MTNFRWIIFLLLCSVHQGSVAAAPDLYVCVDAHGQKVFQNSVVNSSCKRVDFNPVLTVPSGSVAPTPATSKPSTENPYRRPGTTRDDCATAEQRRAFVDRVVKFLTDAALRIEGVSPADRAFFEQEDRLRSGETAGALTVRWQALRGNPLFLAAQVHGETDYIREQLSPRREYDFRSELKAYVKTISALSRLDARWDSYRRFDERRQPAILNDAKSIEIAMQVGWAESVISQLITCVLDQPAVADALAAAERPSRRK